MRKHPDHKRTIVALAIWLAMTGFISDARATDAKVTIGQYDPENQTEVGEEKFCSYCQRYRPIALQIYAEDQKRNACASCLIRALDGELGQTKNNGS